MVQGVLCVFMIHAKYHGCSCTLSPPPAPSSLRSIFIICVQHAIATDHVYLAMLPRTHPGYSENESRCFIVYGPIPATCRLRV
ncbi:unnamed protein product [Periconia digitata]|uniref:Uncharacterized protein n=1 Tax=Periconia digitata TaxID=1303443 RepID=A0A9W4U3F4_9PLEO|nr:unnamed protein product [Periconia digitata]